MKIVSIKNKGLKLFYEQENASKLPSKYIGKIRQVLDALDNATNIQDFLDTPRGHPHKLKGDRKGTYAISVYANWRLTFEYNAEDKSIHTLDFEDYH